MISAAIGAKLAAPKRGQTDGIASARPQASNAAHAAIRLKP
jgi:hypothetical protein